MLLFRCSTYETTFEDVLLLLVFLFSELAPAASEYLFPLTRIMRLSLLKSTSLLDDFVHLFMHLAQASLLQYLMNPFRFIYFCLSVCSIGQLSSLLRVKLLSLDIRDEKTSEV